MEECVCVCARTWMEGCVCVCVCVCARTWMERCVCVCVCVYVLFRWVGGVWCIIQHLVFQAAVEHVDSPSWARLAIGAQDVLLRVFEFLLHGVKLGLRG